jgi:hypothetical protein
MPWGRVSHRVMSGIHQLIPEGQEKKRKGKEKERKTRKKRERKNKTKNLCQLILGYPWTPIIAVLLLSS